MKRLKRSQIASYKKQLLKQQDYICGICKCDMSETPTRDICLDHCHKKGHVRSALCRNCNMIEGKIFNLANRGKRNRTVELFVCSLIIYWNKHADPEDVIYHPDHKTADEKRLVRNKKAKLARARKKALKNVGPRK